MLLRQLQRCSCQLWWCHKVAGAVTGTSATSRLHNAAQLRATPCTSRLGSSSRQPHRALASSLRTVSPSASFSSHQTRRQKKQHRPGGRVTAGGVSQEQEFSPEALALGGDGELDFVKAAGFQLPRYCSGCGVKLQDEVPDAPGYYQLPKKALEQIYGGEEEDEFTGEDEEGEEAQDDAIAHQADDSASAAHSAALQEPDLLAEFDDIVEGWAREADEMQPKASTRLEAFQTPEDEDSSVINVLCARCYSLKHYGTIKSAKAEAALPAFDLGRKVGRKIALQKWRRAVVLCVIDVADFDGSLPRAALQAILPDGIGEPGEENTAEGQVTPSGYRLVLAINKADLLPAAVTNTRLESWVRMRARQGGLPRPTAVFPVSSTKGAGVKELLAGLRDMVGQKGDVWVVGAQNAGKSSLINAMRRAVGIGRGKELTATPVPGTTLGMLKVGGLLPAGCKLLDTPGVPQPFQLHAKLTPDEVRLLAPQRRLKPRTFRIGVGQTILIGGVARVDVLDSPGATLYLTAWVSDDVVLHLGRTEGADERYAKHVGSMLTPPIGGEKRLRQLGPLVPSDVTVSGSGWRASSTDIAIAGLGWVAVGVDGRARFRVWAPQGVATTTHVALVPDLARELEVPGFGSKAVQKGKAGAAGKVGGGGGKKRK